jgi:hypothetical protein
MQITPFRGIGQTDTPSIGQPKKLVGSYISFPGASMIERKIDAVLLKKMAHDGPLTLGIFSLESEQGFVAAPGSHLAPHEISGAENH